MVQIRNNWKYPRKPGVNKMRQNSQDYGLIGSGNSFKDHIDRKEEERCGECHHSWRHCECEEKEE